MYVAKSVDAISVFLQLILLFQACKVHENDRLDKSEINTKSMRKIRMFLCK